MLLLPMLIEGFAPFVDIATFGTCIFHPFFIADLRAEKTNDVTMVECDLTSLQHIQRVKLESHKFFKMYLS